MLQHRGIPHDAAGWARRNVPVLISGPVGPVCWAAALGLVHLLPGLLERKVRGNDRSVLGPPSLFVTLMDCRGAGSLALARDRWEEWVRWGRSVSVHAR